MGYLFKKIIMGTNLKTLILIHLLFSLFTFFSYQLSGQVNEVKLSDGTCLNISNGTYLKANANLTIGKGTSGILRMDGNSIEFDGVLNCSANSDFQINNGTFLFGNYLIDNESTVTYNGTDQEIKNLTYGKLLLNGMGEMSITGDALTPTVCSSLTINNSGNILIIPENKAITVENDLINISISK